MQPPAPEQPPQPQNTKTKQRIPLWVAIVAGLALSLVSCSAGVALNGGIAPVTGAAPSATVTAPAPTVTETTEAEEVTPQSCLDALDYADKGFDAAGDLAGVVIEAFQAISDYDDAGIRKATKKLDKINDRIGHAVDSYTDARDECRSHG